MKKHKNDSSPLLFFLVFLLVFFSSFSASPDFLTDSAFAAVSQEIEDSFKDNEFVPVIVIPEHTTYEGNGVNPSTSSNSGEDLVEELKNKSGNVSASLKENLRPEIDKGNVIDLHFFWIVNAFAAKVNREGLTAIAAMPEVDRVIKDRSHALQGSVAPPAEEIEENPSLQNRPLPWNLQQINAHRIWQRGIYGKDVVVAVMDTGVDPSHPALEESYRGFQEGHDHKTSWFDVAAGLEGSGEKEPNDPNGHGTHIAGVILGGTPSDPQGVAPAARWMAVNIFSEGYAWDSQIIKAFQWLLAPNDNPENAPDIINCSWASRPDYVADPLQWELLHNLEKAGIFVVFAAGNNGAAGPGSPASFPHAFSVGALRRDDEGMVDLANFSSRGIVDWNGIRYPKPELTAPGTGITSAWPGGGHHTLDGTSMAAAHVSGTAALLLEAKPGLLPYQIGYTLKHTARWDASWGEENRPNPRYGHGMVDAFRALTGKDAPAEETLFKDEVEEESDLWNTSPKHPWRASGEKVFEGEFAHADSPWGNYARDAHSWIAIAEAVPLCGYHYPVLSFKHYYDLHPGKSGEEDDYAYVEISPNNRDWVRLYRFSGTNEDFQSFALPVHLPPDTKELHLRFRLESNNSGEGKGWYIDRIQIDAAPLPLTALAALELRPEKSQLGVNEVMQIEVEALFCSKVSRPVDVESVRWSTSDQEIAIVKSGRVTGVSPGEVTIEGRFSGKTAEVNMEVVRVAAPEASPAAGLFYNSVEVELIPPKPGVEIRYTLDGSKPGPESPLYEEPLKIDSTTIIKARAYDDGIPGPVQLMPFRIKEGGKVEGRVALQGRDFIDDKTRAFFLCLDEKSRYPVAAIRRDGTFSTGLPLGRYALVLERDKYLRRASEFAVLEKGEIIELPPQELRAGDITGSNKVGLADLAALTLAFESVRGEESWNPSADLDGDGVIDSRDLELLRENYGLKGDEL